MSNRPSLRGWSIEEFAASVCGGQSKHKAVAVIGYFDESGTSPQDDIAMYGGMIAKASDWATIEDEWRAKLAEFELSEYHAAHCEKGRKEFARFQKTIRDILTNHFSNLIAKVPGQIIGSAIYYESWEKLVPEKIKENYGGDPLYFSAALALQQVSQWSVNFNGGERVAMVFATHQKHNAPLAQMYADFVESEQWPNLGSITFESPKNLIQLQVADLLCYEMKRSVTNPNEHRQAFDNLKDSGKIGMNFGGFNDENLPALVAKWANLYPSLM